MTKNDTLNKFLTKVLGDKRKTNKINNYLSNFESKGIINKNMVLFFIKVMIIILSYYPEKYDVIVNLFETFSKSKSESKNDLIKLLKKTKIHRYDEFLNDKYMDLIIFQTFDFINNIHQLNKELTINLLNELLLNVSKIKTDNIILKVQIYLTYLRSCNKIVLEAINSKKSQIYLKIVEVCGVTTRIINNFLDRK